MLFNLSADIGEERDLATQHPDKLAALKKLYEAWSVEVDADCRKLGIEPMAAEDSTTAKRSPKQKEKRQP